MIPRLVRSLVGAALTTGLLGLAPLATGVLATHAEAAATSGTPYAKRLTGYLTTPDGVELKYSVMLPAKTGRFPVAMTYSGYDAGSIGGASWLQGDTWMSSELETSLIQHGYAVMGLQMRGTGCSSGTFDLFSKEWGTDGALGVEWAAKQPWSTGKVGMFEWSWPGISQLFVGSRRPAGLAAIAPGMVVTDPLRDVGAPGGALNVTFPGLWWGTIQAAWGFAAATAADEADTTCAANLTRNLAEGQLHSPLVLSTHPFIDSFWKARDLRAQTKRIDVPVLSMVDWQDEEVGARGGYYQDQLDPKKTWVVGTNGQHDIYLSKAFRPTLLGFFDHYLKGRRNGFEKTPHVQLWQDTVAGGPQSSDAQLTKARPRFVVKALQWPVPVSTRRLFLRTDGTLRTTPATKAGTTSTVVAPGPIVNNDIPAAATGMPGGPAGELPWDASAANQPGAMTWTSSKLAHPMTVAGSGSLDLWVSSALPAATLQATITEVRPDGNEIYLQRGWLDLTQRALDPALSTPLRPVHRQTTSAMSPLTPGRLVHARLEIPQFSHTFRAGGVIRVVLDAPSQTGDWLLAQVDAGLITVSSAPKHPSSLALGVLPTPRRIPAPAPCAKLTGTPCRTNQVAVPSGRLRW